MFLFVECPVFEIVTARSSRLEITATWRGESFWLKASVTTDRRCARLSTSLEYILAFALPISKITGKLSQGSQKC